MASSSVPVNYEYTKLNVEEDHKSRFRAGSSYDSKANISGSDNYSPSSSYTNSNNIRFFWDGGLLANKPPRRTVIAHRDYWYTARKIEDNLPSLSIGIINLHPLKQGYVPYDYDGVVNRKNDIMYHDRTQFDEYVAVLMSDFQKLATALIKLSKDNGVSILNDTKQ